MVRDGFRIISLGEIAKFLGVSAGHLSRSFRDCFGLGPTGAFELIRLGRAAVALQNTHSSLARIASECGFSDEYYLSRRFSRIYGLPPGAYRRTQQDAEPLAPLIERQLLPLWASLTNERFLPAPIRGVPSTSCVLRPGNSPERRPATTSDTT